MALLAGMAIYFFSSYNNGYNLFNQLIIERMSYDEDRFIVGNDRSNDVIDKTFNNAWADGSIFAGISKEAYSKMMKMGAKGAGAKPFMLEHGILGTFFLALGYFLVSRTSKYKRWATLLFLVYAISFLQRAYFFWAGYYIPYICGMVFYVQEHYSQRTILLRSTDRHWNQT